MLVPITALVIVLLAILIGVAYRAKKRVEHEIDEHRAPPGRPAL